MSESPKSVPRNPEDPALRSSSLDDMPRFIRPMMEFILLVSVYLGCIIVLVLAAVAVVMVTVNLLAGGSTAEVSPALAWLMP
ncbi:MAG: hypothetical protein RIE53_08435 [Rhodothermales bacterium]